MISASEEMTNSMLLESQSLFTFAVYTFLYSITKWIYECNTDSTAITAFKVTDKCLNKNDSHNNPTY